MNDKICLSRFLKRFKKFLPLLGLLMATTGPLAVIKGLVEVEEELGEFIANGPATGLGGHVRDQYRKRCNEFANLPPWAKLLTAGAGGSVGRICQPYWDNNGWTGPTNSPAFIGGQCYGLTYSFTLSYNNAQNVRVTTDQSISGRLIGTFVGPENQFGNRPVGVERQLSPGAPTDQIPYANIPSSISPAPSLSNVRRQDGGLDNCGDPPTEFKPGPNPPPDPGPTPGPEPTTDPSNPTGPPLLPIPDYEDPVGGPTPIVGPDPSTPTLPTSPTGGNPDSLPGGPENVGEPIEVDPGVGGGGGGTDFGPPPPGRVWVGCLLRFTIPDEVGSIPGSGPTNPVVAAVFGNASLIVTGGLDTPERVNGANMMLVRKSAAVNVNGVYVNVKPGFTYTVKPLSLEKCPADICGAE